MDLFMIALVVLTAVSVCYAVIMKISMMALLAFLIKEKHVDFDSIPKEEIKWYTSKAAKELFGLRN